MGLEALEPSRFETVCAWLAAPQINQWLGSEWRGRQINSVLLAMAVRNKRNEMFVITHDGDPCGLVALSDLDVADGTAMIWYFLGEQSLSGRGIATAAVRELSTLAFTTRPIVSLYAWAMECNVPSRRVLEKAGFREAGRLRQAASFGGRQVDRIYYDAVGVEYLQSSPG
jgi:RimJ/RimL family protein N-acetyltransferase